jgi:hypothetical protein
VQVVQAVAVLVHQQALETMEPLTQVVAVVVERLAVALELQVMVVQVSL